MAAKTAEDIPVSPAIKVEHLQEYLGPIRFTSEAGENSLSPGVVMGLAWTPVGGEILFIEATSMKGKKGMTLTGQLGEVMKESAMAALSFIRTNARRYNIDEDFYEKMDFHIHVPSGAIPKDGPSAGVTILTALVSLLTGRRVKNKLAMTGEITLRGKVMPIGGVKEKVIAAHRAGIKEVVLPAANEKDTEEIPAKVKKDLAFHYAATMDDVLNFALPKKERMTKKKTPRGGTARAKAPGKKRPA